MKILKKNIWKGDLGQKIDYMLAVKNVLFRNDARFLIWYPRRAKTATHLFSMDAIMLSVRLWGMRFNF